MPSIARFTSGATVIGVIAAMLILTLPSGTIVTIIHSDCRRSNMSAQFLRLQDLRRRRDDWLRNRQFGHRPLETLTARAWANVGQSYAAYCFVTTILSRPASCNVSPSSRPGQQGFASPAVIRSIASTILSATA